MASLSKRALRIVVPAATAAAALLLAGCAGATSATPASARPTDFAGVKLTVWNTIDYDPYQSLQKKYFEQCAADLNIAVDVQTIQDSTTKYLAAASSKSLPDIAQLSTDVQLPTLAAQGVLADLGSLGVTTDGQADTVAALGKYQGTLYGQPSQVEDYAIFYDKAAFATAGITSDPTTFDEFVADAKAVKDATGKGVAFSGVTGDGSVAAYFLPWILSAGGDPADTTNSGTVAAVDLYKQLVANGSLSKEFVNWGWDATDQWTGGKAAITVSGPWNLVDSSLKVDYGTAAFPTASTGSTSKVGLLGYAYAIPASDDTQKQQAAAALLECRDSEADQLETAEQGGYIPSLTSAQQQFVAKVPAAKPFVDAVASAYNPATLGSDWNTLQNVYSTALQDVGTTSDSAQKALENAAASQ